MSDIRFYHLLHAPLERALPRLLTKVTGRGHRVVVLADTTERVAWLDNLLWVHEKDSWLPHGRNGDGDESWQPILLSIDETNPNQADVLLTLEGRQATDPSVWPIWLNLFDGRDDTAVARAREHWKRLRTAGHDLTYWRQTESGGWEQKG